MKGLRLECPDDFVSLLRMEPAMFYEVLLRVGPRITKTYTNYRGALEPELKLAITPHFLGSFH